MFNHLRFKAARIAAGLTQKDLGDAIGVQQATVSFWESGRRSPHPTKIRLLSELLRIHPDALLPPTPDGAAPTLKDHRQAAGLSQALLAVRLDMRPSTLGDIERGRFLPHDEQLVAWCRQLDISMDMFDQAWWQARHRRDNSR